MDAPGSGVLESQSLVHSLPEEIWIEIFSFFAYTTSARQAWRYGQGYEKKQHDLTTLTSGRLVCRMFNQLISPLLCPVIKITIDSHSVTRLTGLLSNPSIAYGVRGVKIGLHYRPRALGTDLSKYCAHVTRSVIEPAIRRCDFCTEFQDYEPTDESPDAVEWRAFHAAWDRLYELENIWRDYVENFNDVATSEAMSTKAKGGDDGFREKWQTLLQESFNVYAAKHVQQNQMISDGSFARAVATALSRCPSPLYLWLWDRGRVVFHDDVEKLDPLALLDKPDAVATNILVAEGWYALEQLPSDADGDDSDNLLPVQLLTAIPIACHAAGARLQGISFGAFPQFKGFEYLLSPSSDNPSTPRTTWATDSAAVKRAFAPFAAACEGIDQIDFCGAMRCLGPRSQRLNARDACIVEHFLRAACGGATDVRLKLRLFAAKKQFRRTKTENMFKGCGLLKSLSWTRLQRVSISDVQVCAKHLEQALRGLRVLQLQYVRLSSVVLCQPGLYRETMNILHEVSVAASGREAKLRISFSSLLGGEFGHPERVDNNDWFLIRTGQDNDFFGRIDNYLHPPLLQAVEAWIERGNLGEENPLRRVELHMI